MPFCPKCKYEYVPGIAACPDCRVELVDRLRSEEPTTESGAAATRCDICGDLGPGTMIDKHRLSAAVALGFNPFERGLVSPNVRAALTYEQWFELATKGVLANTDWLVCPKCVAHLRPYLSTIAACLGEPGEGR